MTFFLASCAAKQSYQPVYAPTYVPTPYVAYRSANPRADYPPISYEDLLRFEYDCGNRLEQINFLEDQLRKKTFYRVDGVEGNDFPDRISKKYFALGRYRIWSLRLGCRGSGVSKAAQAKLNGVLPNRPPEVVLRCYFEEGITSKSSVGESEDAGQSLVSRRREVCTNYPLITNTKEIHLGDVVDPAHQLDKNNAYVFNLSKWNGNIFQMVSKTEMHRKEIVKFTVVFMWSPSGWVVVDKF
jgi:hypothetical protein